MNYKIVVARYNENIEWLHDVSNDCIFYNKGDKVGIKNEIMLKNVGRESETYLNYIIDNYENLPEIIIFTQANISDHRGSNDVNYLFKLYDEAKLYGKSLPTVEHNYINNPNKNWGPFWNIHPEHNETFFLNNNYNNNNRITFYDWFIKYIDKEYPNPINIYSNGLFAVKKEIILQRTIDYYKKLIAQVNHHVNSTEGHFFERSWFYIFDNKIKIDKTIISNKNKLIYFYSPLYNFYNTHIVKTLREFFVLDPILIDDLKNNKKGHTFSGGVTIKIELIIQKIKENFNNFIVFSDATIFINENNASTLSNFLDEYKNNDLCFADNNINSQYNIGFILIKCNNNTLTFFNNVLIDLNINKGWDQEVINIHLQNNKNITVNVFDNTKIVCGYNFNPSYKDTYLIYKSFIHHTSNLNLNFNTRLEILKNNNLITEEDYNINKK